MASACCLFRPRVLLYFQIAKFNLHKQTSNLFRDEGRSNTAVVVRVRFQKICLIREQKPARVKKVSQTLINFLRFVINDAIFVIFTLFYSTVVCLGDLKKSSARDDLPNLFKKKIINSV